MDAKCELLRHALATLAYRAQRALNGVPSGFANFSAGAKCRTSAEIVAHLGDLLDWTLTSAAGKPQWRNSQPLPWDQECERFFAALRSVDDFLASGKELGAPAENLLQGPIADAFTHVGQIAMLRRLAGAPMKGENYYVAEIRAGRVGMDQPAPVIQF